MKLKCIGGKCDGMLMNVNDQLLYRQGETVRVPHYPQKLTDVDFTHSNSIPDLIEAYYEFYVIDVLKYSHKNSKDTSEIWFLRPSNLTIWDCIQFQFNKV